MFRPVEVKALSGYRLWVRFSDGVEGEIDLGHLVWKGVFALWNDPAAFEKVYVGDYGQISWSDTVDICSDAIYLRVTGKTPEQLFPSLVPEAVHA
jgi:hypothetical protein